MNTNRYSDRTPPILLIAFNRPKQTAVMLERIKAAHPSALYVACDGPREGRDDDRENVGLIRKMVDSIDWCDNVKTLFQTANLGCGPGVSEAISWFLNDAEEGIILEDDCLPDLSFFPFCGEMLDRYRTTTNVAQIAGYNYLSGLHETEFDYVFSHYGWQWGWATWKRAWDHFDLRIPDWPKFKELGYHRYFPFYRERVQVLDESYAGKTTAWSYQWHFAMGSNSWLSVIPKFNLIDNIGFGPDATHGTSEAGSETYRLPIRPMPFPIKHCPFLYADQEYDRMSIRVFRAGGIRKRVKNALGDLSYWLFSR